jgi:hypothetical protein
MTTWLLFWHAVPADDYGYGILTVFNDTHLSWEFHRATDDTVQDQVVVIKNL